MIFALCPPGQAGAAGARELWAAKQTNVAGLHCRDQ
jgi:hypothetical protein